MSLATYEQDDLERIRRDLEAFTPEDLGTGFRGIFDAGEDDGADIQPSGDAANPVLHVSYSISYPEVPTVMADPDAEPCRFGVLELALRVERCPAATAFAKELGGQIRAHLEAQAQGDHQYLVEGGSYRAARSGALELHYLPITFFAS